MDARWRIELFGGLRARRGDDLVTRFRASKAALLLAYLAYYHRRAHPREELVQLLWPEHDPTAGRRNLRVALTRLRRQMEPPGVAPGSVLIADRVAVQLNPAACVTDVEEFEAALRSAGRADSPGERAQWLAQAVEQYHGELLPRAQPVAGASQAGGRL